MISLMRRPVHRSPIAGAANINAAAIGGLLECRLDDQSTAAKITIEHDGGGLRRPEWVPRPAVGSRFSFHAKFSQNEREFAYLGETGRDCSVPFRPDDETRARSGSAATDFR